MTSSVGRANWLHLDEGEEVLWTGRPSRFTIAVPVLGGSLLLLVALFGVFRLGPSIADLTGVSWLFYAPLMLGVVGMIWAGYAYLEWLRLRYVLTNQEIYVKHGLVSRDVTQVRLERVQNTAFEQSVAERLLRYGNVRVYTAGSGTEDLTFEKVPTPQAVTRLLTESLTESPTRGGDRVRPSASD